MNTRWTLDKPMASLSTCQIERVASDRNLVQSLIKLFKRSCMFYNLGWGGNPTLHVCRLMSQHLSCRPGLSASLAVSILFHPSRRSVCGNHTRVGLSVDTRPILSSAAVRRLGTTTFNN